MVDNRYSGVGYGPPIEDDPQDRAPFTEAMDTIDQLRARIAELEAEVERLRKMLEPNPEVEKLKAELAALRKEGDGGKD